MRTPLLISLLPMGGCYLFADGGIDCTADGPKSCFPDTDTDTHDVRVQRLDEGGNARHRNAGRSQIGAEALQDRDGIRRAGSPVHQPVEERLDFARHRSRV